LATPQNKRNSVIVDAGLQQLIVYQQIHFPLFDK